MGLQDELRKAVAANDVPRVHDLLDKIARAYRRPFEMKLAAIKDATPYHTRERF